MLNRNLQDLNVYYKPSRDSVQTKQSPVTTTLWGYFNLILPLHKRRYRSIQGSYVRGPHIRYESEKTYYFLKLRALQPLNTFLSKIQLRLFLRYQEKRANILRAYESAALQLQPPAVDLQPPYATPMRITPQGSVTSHPKLRGFIMRNISHVSRTALRLSSS